MVFRMYPQVLCLSRLVPYQRMEMKGYSSKNLQHFAEDGPNVEQLAFGSRHLQGVSFGLHLSKLVSLSNHKGLGF